MHVGVAGKFSNVPGATGEAACVDCGAGERWMVLARDMIASSLCAYFGGGCSTRVYVDSGKYSVIDHMAGACHYVR
jgi:hypothetical protein